MSDNLLVLLLISLMLLLVSITSASPLLDFQSVLKQKPPLSAEIDGAQKDEVTRNYWSPLKTLNRSRRNLQMFGPNLNMQLDKRWKKMSAWGKRDEPILDKKWKQMSAWGKRDQFPLDKKWKQMSAWGKRDQFPLDKKWKQMSAWGKRDKFPFNKKWKQMSAWGKRDAPPLDKKWKQMSAARKRGDSVLVKKWKQMSAWGKRGGSVPDKKWKQMSAWGKREGSMPGKKWKQMSAWGKREDVIPDKKWKQMSAWGKRDNIITHKKWKQMSAWGKRDADLLKYNILNIEDTMTPGAGDELGQGLWDAILSEEGSIDANLKSVFLSDTSGLSPVIKGNTNIAVVDKGFTKSVDNLSASKRWANQKDWGKRPSWSRTGFSGWGKRSADGIDLRKLKAALLRLKPALGGMSLQD